MRGWHFESNRHSLAARGIRTRAILNPIANDKYYSKKVYGRKEGMKGIREYRGSGLTGIYTEDIMRLVRRVLRMIRTGKGLRWLRSKRYIPIELESVYLMGSRVTGFYTGESDLDVYVQIDKPIKRNENTIEKRFQDAMLWFKIEYETEGGGLRIRDDIKDEWIRIDMYIGWETPEEAWERGMRGGWDKGKPRPILKIWERGR